MSEENVYDPDNMLRCPIDLNHQTNWVLTGTNPDKFGGEKFYSRHILWCGSCLKVLAVEEEPGDPRYDQW